MKLTTEELLRPKLPKPNLNEEDFWVFSLNLGDDPKAPTWDRGITVLGSYQQCVAASAKAINDLGIPKKGLRIEVFQGDIARNVLAHHLQEELRYRNERNMQPNN
jgi:hypothetical protein